MPVALRKEISLGEHYRDASTETMTCDAVGKCGRILRFEIFRGMRHVEAARVVPMDFVNFRRVNSCNLSK